MKVRLIKGNHYHEGQKIAVGECFDCSESWFTRNCDRVSKVVPDKPKAVEEVPQVPTVEDLPASESKPTPRIKAPKPKRKRVDK